MSVTQNLKTKGDQNLNTDEFQSFSYRGRI